MDRPQRIVPRTVTQRGAPRTPPPPPPAGFCCSCRATGAAPHPRDPPSRSPAPQPRGAAVDRRRPPPPDGSEPPGVAEALGSVLASCHIGGAAPDSAIDRSFIAAGLAARTLEKFLSHRPARAPSPAGTDTDSGTGSGTDTGGSGSDGDGEAGGLRGRHGAGPSDGAPGSRGRGAAWRAVRSCCAAVEVLSGAERREQRRDDEIRAEHGGLRASPSRGNAVQGCRARPERRDERHRRGYRDGTEPCACCTAEGGGAPHREGRQRPPALPCHAAPPQPPAHPHGCACIAPRRHRERRVVATGSTESAEMGGGVRTPPERRLQPHHREPPRQSRHGPPLRCQEMNAVQLITKSFELRAQRDAARAERDGQRCAPPGGGGRFCCCCCCCCAGGHRGGGIPMSLYLPGIPMMSHVPTSP
ncbi:5E5 antigen-like [Phasianus colchicus]|uniref:5E5 antigen-like n=1 Tax=Phasianus colchicus TaxID=9054 RepID=UPI00129E9994|nr:5E5 antigen-like [Phasianus colchicus]